MIGAAELVDLRRDSDSALPDTAVIERATSGIWATLLTLVPCRMAPISQRQSDQALATLFGPGNLRVVTLPALTNIAVGDRVVILEHTYEVVDLPAPRSEEIARRLVVRELG